MWYQHIRIRIHTMSNRYTNSGQRGTGNKRAKRACTTSNGQSSNGQRSRTTSKAQPEMRTKRNAQWPIEQWASIDHSATEKWTMRKGTEQGHDDIVSMRSRREVNNPTATTKCAPILASDTGAQDRWTILKCCTCLWHRHTHTHTHAHTYTRTHA
jgi:hypothetical protein